MMICTLKDRGSLLDLEEGRRRRRDRDERAMALV
jgi:hypothetical protein